MFESLFGSEMPLAARFFIVPVRSQRSALPGEIERFVPKQIPATQCLSAEQALQLVRRFDDRTLVTGSLFLVGEVLSILNPAGAAFQTSNQ